MRGRATVEPPVLEFPKSGGPNMPFPRGGWTPLMYAAREGALDAARALVELGANLNVVALPQTDVALTDAVRKAADTVGTTALVYAIINAHFDLAAMLIDEGANPNIVDTSGMAALYAAVEMSTLQWVQSRPAPIWKRHARRGRTWSSACSRTVPIRTRSSRRRRSRSRSTLAPRSTSAAARRR